MRVLLVIFIIASAAEVLIAEDQTGLPVFHPHEPITRPVETREPVVRPEPVYKEEKDRQSFSLNMLSNGQERIKHETADANAVAPIAGYGYDQTGQPVAYPDIPYAPGYGYEPVYGKQAAYDRYGVAMGTYEDPEPYPVSTLGLMWSAMPDARDFAVGFARTIGLVLSGGLVLALGILLTFGVCKLSGACDVSLRGVTPTTFARSLMSNERLEQLGVAAGILHKALVKYGPKDTKMVKN